MLAEMAWRQSEKLTSGATLPEGLRFHRELEDHPEVAKLASETRISIDGIIATAKGNRLGLPEVDARRRMPTNPHGDCQ